jgi:steroid delta-isomerase-like uncharacterized protein
MRESVKSISKFCGTGQHTVRWVSNGQFILRGGAYDSRSENFTLPIPCLLDYLSGEFDMSEIENQKQVIRDWVEEVENQGNLARIPHLATPEYAQIYRQSRERSLSTFPDRQLVIHELVAEDDKVMAVWEAKATHQGNWRGVPPNVKPVTWRGMTLYYIQDGKIAEEITSWNRLDMYEQLVGLPDWFAN